MATPSNDERGQDMERLRAQLRRLFDRSNESTAVASSSRFDSNYFHRQLDEHEQRLQVAERQLLRVMNVLLLPNENGNDDIPQSWSDIAIHSQNLQHFRAQQLSLVNAALRRPSTEHELGETNEHETRIAVDNVITRDDTQSVEPENATHHMHLDEEWLVRSSVVGGPLDVLVETDHETDGTRTTPGSGALSLWSPTYSRGRSSGRASSGKLSNKTTTPGSWGSHPTPASRGSSNPTPEAQLLLSSSTVQFLQQHQAAALHRESHLTPAPNEPRQPVALATSTKRSPRPSVLHRNLLDLQQTFAALSTSKPQTTAGGTTTSTSTAPVQHQTENLEDSPVSLRHSYSSLAPSDETVSDIKQPLPTAARGVTIYRDLHPRRLSQPDNVDRNHTSVVSLEQAIGHHRGAPAADDGKSRSNSVDSDAESASLCSDDDDSALYCATVINQDVVPPLAASAQKNRFQLPALGGRSAASTPSSKIDVTHVEFDPAADSSPTSTNLTLDMTMVAFGTNASRIVQSAVKRTYEPRPSDEYDDDDDDAASVETAFLDRYRLDRDDTSPHGFRVVPNARGTRRNKAKPQDVRHFFANEKKRPSDTTTFSLPPLTSGAGQQPTTATHTPLNKIATSKKVYRKTPYKKAPATPTIDENAPLNVAYATMPRATLLLSPEAASLEKQRAPVVSRSTDNAPSRHLSTAAANTNTVAFVPIPPISVVEYEQAPKVVQLQVQLDQVERAVMALNQAGRATVSLAEATEILALEPRVAKAIMMSLCHWRRLLMRKRDQDFVFEMAVELPVAV